MNSGKDLANPALFDLLQQAVQARQTRMARK
jgi:hypothetical protein